MLELFNSVRWSSSNQRGSVAAAARPGADTVIEVPIMRWEHDTVCGLIGFLATMVYCGAFFETSDGLKAAGRFA